MTIWVSERLLTTMHDEQLAEHGGAPGIRDAGLLENALARPVNRAGYGDPDIIELGALYAVAIARNHPFIDGNKRAGFMAMVYFLAANGAPLVATEAEAVVAMLDMASGDLNDDEFILWVREHTGQPD